MISITFKEKLYLQKSTLMPLNLFMGSISKKREQFLTNAPLFFSPKFLKLGTDKITYQDMFHNYQYYNLYQNSFVPFLNVQNMT